MSVMLCFFFFFKQKTAYEMLRSLVGSEMCIRDRGWGVGGEEYRCSNGRVQEVCVMPCLSLVPVAELRELILINEGAY